MMVQRFLNPNTQYPFVCFAKQPKVVLSDEFAAIFSAKHLIVLIGELPNLISPNSQGVYYSYQSKIDPTNVRG